MHTPLAGWFLPPNLLTYARVGLTPFVAAAIWNDQGVLALVLVAIAGLSDGLDGFLARRFGWQSALGAYLDPIADKLLLVTIYLSFGMTGTVPMWLVTMVLLRDAWILAMVTYAWFATTIRDFPPRWAGKASTALQLALAAALLVRGGVPELLGQAVVDILVLLVMGMAAISGVDYTVVALRRYLEWHRTTGSPISRR